MRVRLSYVRFSVKKRYEVGLPHVTSSIVIRKSVK
jgi:hypothetical protein